MIGADRIDKVNLKLLICECDGFSGYSCKERRKQKKRSLQTYLGSIRCFLYLLRLLYLWYRELVLPFPDHSDGFASVWCQCCYKQVLVGPRKRYDFDPTFDKPGIFFRADCRHPSRISTENTTLVVRMKN